MTRTVSVDVSGLRLLDVRQVAVKVTRSPRWVWSAVSAGSFPQPVQISDRGTRWFADEVDDWIESFRVARDERRAA
jgi:predicted DNA-binding transcriptional regulator AlpA